MKKKRFCYIASSGSTFVIRDVKLLKSICDVDLKILRWNSPIQLCISYIKQFFFLIFNLHKYNAVIIMFAGYWAILPVLLGRILKIPTFIILGGTDCVSYPELGYGSLRKPVQKKIIKISVNNATGLWPVDESLIFSKNTYYNNSYQGVKYYFEKIKTPYTIIDNGYDRVIPDVDYLNKNSNTFLSIGLADDFGRYSLKGLDLIIENAKFHPECRFTIIGIYDNLRERIPFVPENVKIYGILPFHQMESIFRSHQYYIQCSISEGFPNALCEAMSYGCIPLVSDVGAMQRIVADCGFIIKKRGDQEFNDLITRMKNLDNLIQKELSEKSIERISSNYSSEKRKKQFENELMKYINY